MKSKRVRRKLENLLMRNIKSIARKNGYKIKLRKVDARIIGEFEGDHMIFKKVFGLVSYSPAIKCKADLEEIKKIALKIMDGKSFAIRCKRIDKSFPYTSREVNELVGSYVKEKSGAKVDLENPQVEIGIEIIDGYAYIFKERIPAHGGLPVYSQGKVLCLISGGVDSALAAWYMMKRGCDIVALNFEINKEVGEAFDKVCDKLEEFHPDKIKRIKLPYEPIKKKILKVKDAWRCILCKHLMLKKAEEIAKKEGCLAICTGDSLGQVASQTLENLRCESYSIGLPILRPLIGMDKDEIIRMAREIGIFDLALKKFKCPYAAKKPVTKAKIGRFKSILKIK